MHLLTFDDFSLRALLRGACANLARAYAARVLSTRAPVEVETGPCNPSQNASLIDTSPVVQRSANGHLVSPSDLHLREACAKLTRTLRGLGGSGFEGNP